MLQKREKGGDCTCSSVSFFGGGPTNAFGFGSAPSSAQPASTTCESQLKEATLLIFRPRTILCNKGDNCKYSHVMPGEGTNNNPQMSSQVGGGGWNDSFDSSANNNNMYYVYRGGIKNNPVNSLLKENADLELRVTSKIRMTLILLLHRRVLAVVSMVLQAQVSVIIDNGKRKVLQSLSTRTYCI